MKYIILILTSLFLIGCGYRVVKGITSEVRVGNMRTAEGAVRSVKAELLILCLKNGYTKSEPLKIHYQESIVNGRSYFEGRGVAKCIK